METRANNILIGAFVLTGLALAIAFGVWIARTGETGPRKSFYVVFSGSVQGLSVGGAVLFNGLRVGEVTEIRVNPGNTSEIRARINVDSLTPVKRDTRVRLTYQGLTGVAAIEFSGGTERAGDLTPGLDNVPPALFAERSFVQNILEGGQDTLSRVNAVIARVEDLVIQNQENVATTLKNIRDFSDALAQNSQGVATLLSDASIAARRIADVSARLESVVNAIEPGRVGEIVDNTASITSAIAAQRDAIASTIADAGRASRALAETAERLRPGAERLEQILAAVEPETLRRAMDGIDRSAQGVARITEAVDPDRVRRTVESVESIATTLAAERERIASVVQDVGTAARNVAQASERLTPVVTRADQLLQAVDTDSVRRTIASVERSSRDIERFAASVGGESQTVQTIIREANEVVASLRRSASSIEGLATSLGGEGGSGAGGVLREFTETARSIRTVAENLDRRISSVTNGLSRFTDGGLRDLQSLINDGRRTIGNVDRALRDIERNPQQFIFGRSGVPEFRR